MLPKTHKTAAVIIPPNDLWPPIQAIRKKHDRQLRRWMPHITLIYPFRPLQEFTDLAEQFARACRKVTPFEIQLNKLGYFEHGRGNYTIWLAPHPEESVIQLQSILRSIVPDCDDVNRFASGFAPHLSVGQVKGPSRLAELTHRLNELWKSVSFVVREVNFVWRDDPPDDIFRPAQTVKLSG
ncbi:MAG: 2'-5' RNA ligase family protein [Deltaproteobacteria bacterium]|nr:MAG: 2'-5' RNA ligase family protein [Deltaproteobacteria bacterium]